MTTHLLVNHIFYYFNLIQSTLRRTLFFYLIVSLNSFIIKDHNCVKIGLIIT